MQPFKMDVEADDEPKWLVDSIYENGSGARLGLATLRFTDTSTAHWAPRCFLVLDNKVNGGFKSLAIPWRASYLPLHGSQLSMARCEMHSFRGTR